MAQANYTLTLQGEERVAAALGSLRSKTPVAVKNAANATATRARRLLIQTAQLRYALSVKGRKHLNELKIRSRATVSNPSAELYISSRAGNLADFKTNPTRPYMGKSWKNAPPVQYGKVLKSEPMKPLTGKTEMSKGFLLEFANGHVGMVQRRLGQKSENTMTARSRRPRWKSRGEEKIVEITANYYSPSASAMHSKSWREGVKGAAEEILQEQLKAQTEKILARATR